MAKLTDEQQRQLDELTALRDAPDEQPDDDGDDDHDDGVIVLRGKRADDFLGSLFGSRKKKKREQPPADDDDDQDDGDDDDQDDEPEPDKKPRSGHRYFS